MELTPVVVVRVILGTCENVINCGREIVPANVKCQHFGILPVYLVINRLVSEPVIEEDIVLISVL